MIRVTRDCEDTDTGFLFWKGETFSPCSEVDPVYGVEVKTAGEYVWIPADAIEVLPEP